MFTVRQNKYLTYAARIIHILVSAISQVTVQLMAHSFVTLVMACNATQRYTLIMGMSEIQILR